MPRDDDVLVRMLLVAAMGRLGVDRITLTEPEAEQIARRYGLPMPVFVWDDGATVNVVVMPADELSTRGAAVLVELGMEPATAQTYAAALALEWAAAQAYAATIVDGMRSQQEDRRN